MSIARNVAKLAQQGVRQVATTPVARSAASNIPEGYHQLKVTQAKFQVPNGQPIFLKGGTSDKILYQITMALSLVGVGGILKLIYDLSVPKTE